MRTIIDGVFYSIYYKIADAKPNIIEKIGDLNKPKPLKLKLDVFPCYRSILNKITESCFSLPQVRINVTILEYKYNNRGQRKLCLKNTK